MRQIASRFVPSLLGAAWLAASALTPASGETVAKVPSSLQQQILADPGTELAGPANAKVRVVEYFDYNCPFCRKLAPNLSMLRSESPDVSLTFKDWPIFGGVSVYAAKSAIASQWQGKYLKAHDALMSAPRLMDEAQVDAALQKAGVDLPRLKQDMKQHNDQIDALLTRNAKEAKAIGLRGTPGLIVGQNVESNIDGLDDLKTAGRARPLTGDAETSPPTR